MKKTLVFLLTLFLNIDLAAEVFKNLKDFEPKQHSKKITFTENKGQVSDQNYKPRPDILFGGSTNSMVFHLLNNILCVIEQATLTAGGALSYTFNPGGAAPNIIVSPLTTVSYTISGEDINGCSSKAIVTQNVDACTSVRENSGVSQRIKVFPNPTKGIVFFELDSNMEITVLNSLGQIIYACSMNSEIHQVNLHGLAKGLYVVKVENTIDQKVIKLIME